MLKVKNDIAPKIVEELFASEISTYDFCNNNLFWTRVNSVWHGTDCVPYIGPKMLDLVPPEIKKIWISQCFQIQN